MEQSTLRKKLMSEVDRVSWRPLAPHHERGVLWLLAMDLDLVEVGMAVAEDRVSDVSAWIQTGQLRRPTDGEVQAWFDDPVAQHFAFLIVQPFVLAVEFKGSEKNHRDAIRSA